jgi:tetratricopeptide (TPR) repeat protein
MTRSWLPIARGSWTAAIALVAAVALAPGCSTPDEKFEQHLQRAKRFEAEGALDAAQIELRSALQLRPQSAEANFLTGELLVRRDRRQDAVFFFQEAYRLDPTRHDARLATAGLLLRADPDEAERLVEQVIQDEPQNAAAYARRAELRLVRSDVDGALTAALTAVELAPAAPAHLLLLGRTYQARIQLHQQRQEQPPDATFRAAVKAFERAAAAFERLEDRRAADAGAVEALNERARTLASWEGHERESVEAFREAVKRAEATGDAGLQGAALRASLALSLQRRDTELQRETIEKLIALAPADPGPWQRLAELDQQQGGSAEAVYRRFAREQPQTGVAHVLLARHLIGAGRTEDGLAVLEAAVVAEHDLPLLLATLAEEGFAAGREEQANAAIERLAREFPDAPQTAVSLAQRASREGRPAEAIEQLEKALARRGWPEAHAQLAIAQLATGSLEAAIRSIDRGMELASGPWPSGERIRLRIRAAAGDWPGVLRSARAIEESHVALPPDEIVLAAQAFYQVGRAEAGRELLGSLLEAEPPPTAALLLFAEREGANNSKRARALLDEALARDPDDLQLATARIQLELSAGHLDEAARLLDAAIGATEASSAQLLALRAQLLEAQQRFEGSSDTALEALRLDPNLAGVAMLAARTGVRAGRAEQVLEVLLDVEREGRLGDEGLETLARLQLQLGQQDDARASYERLLARSPSRPAAQNDLAYLLAKSGQDVERALELASQAQKARPTDPYFADTLGFVYLRRGLPEAALEQFRFAAQALGPDAPATAMIEYHRGLALSELQRHDEAREAFERAISAAPESDEAREARAGLEQLPPRDDG